MLAGKCGGDKSSRRTFLFLFYRRRSTNLARISGLARVLQYAGLLINNIGPEFMTTVNRKNKQGYGTSYTGYKEICAGENRRAALIPGAETEKSLPKDIRWRCLGGSLHIPEKFSDNGTL